MLDSVRRRRHAPRVAVWSPVSANVPAFYLLSNIHTVHVHIRVANRLPPAPIPISPTNCLCASCASAQLPQNVHRLVADERSQDACGWRTGAAGADMPLVQASANPSPRAAARAHRIKKPISTHTRCTHCAAHAAVGAVSSRASWQCRCGPATMSRRGTTSRPNGEWVP